MTLRIAFVFAALAGAAIARAWSPATALEASEPAQCVVFVDPAELYRANDEVFSGTVTAVEPTGLDGFHIPRQIATVRVQEQWKGVRASTIRVATTDRLFEVGASYLFFAGGEPLSTSLMCRGTEKLEAASAKQSWLNSLPSREVGDPSPALKAVRSVVLDAEPAAPFFKGQLCSRPGAGSRDQAWSPDASTLVRLEIALARDLQAALNRMTWPSGIRVTATDYYRQYAGFISGGRKRVYINGFHEAAVEQSEERNRGPLSWRERALLVCDGGRSFFGAVYDVDTGTIRNLNFHPGRF